MSRLGAAVVLHVKSITVSLYSRERSRKGWGHSASRFDRAIWPTDAEHETLVYNWRTDLRPRYLIIARSLPRTSSHDFRVSTHSIYCILPPRKTDSTCTVKIIAFLLCTEPLRRSRGLYSDLLYSSINRRNDITDKIKDIPWTVDRSSKC